MTNEKMLSMLRNPRGKVDVVLDTDAYNEIDDQFAIAYMLRCGEELNPVAIYAAPFFNEKSSGPEDGMLRSYDEILHITALAGWNHPEKVYLGSRTYLMDEYTPVVSPAAEDLASRAMQYTSEHPLYVVAIGAITNVASALLLNPDIRERIVVVWLGGHALHWHDTKEFNMRQDFPAARVVLGCGVPVVLLPCMGVVSHLTTTEPELRCWLLDRNPLCDYLARNTMEAANSYARGKPWSRVLWDVAAVAWVADRKECFLLDRKIPSAIPDLEGNWTLDENRHLMRYVYGVNRDALMEDMIKRLTQA